MIMGNGYVINSVVGPPQRPLIEFEYLAGSIKPALSVVCLSVHPGSVT